MYRLAAPAPDLQKYIETYWSVYAEPGQTTQFTVDVYVDARADLIFNFGAPYSRVRLPDQVSQHQRSNLDAQRTYPIAIHQSGEVQVAGVRFHAGGLAPFVEGPLDRFTDQTPALAEVFPADQVQRLEVALEKAGADLEGQGQLLDEFFLECLRLKRGFELFWQAKQRIESEPGLTLATLAEELGLSPRSLTRMFRRLMGMTPSCYAGIARFQRALSSLMKEPDTTLAQLAVDCGYFDQAHFIKDFKRYAGGIPGRYRGYFPECGPDDFAPNVVQFASVPAPI